MSAVCKNIIKVGAMVLEISYFEKEKKKKPTPSRDVDIKRDYQLILRYSITKSTISLHYQMRNAEIRTNSQPKTLKRRRGALVVRCIANMYIGVF